VPGAVGAAADTGSGPPIFPTRIDVVNINVSVTDTRNRFVTDLAEGDFAVFENGAPQKVVLFAPGTLPLSISLLIDSSSSMQSSLSTVRTAALRLIGTMGPQDEGAVIQFNHRYRVLQDTTRDLTLLGRAIGEIQAEGATSLNNALYIALKEARSLRVEQEPRRRAIVVLSDGVDTSSLLDEDRVLALARQAGVTVYPVRLRRPGVPTSDTGPGSSNYFLNALARETGGRACFAVGAHELDGTYDKIAEELRTQYGLAYVSTNPRPDGRWRSIAVQAARPGLTIRHKTGYYPRDPLR